MTKQFWFLGILLSVLLVLSLSPSTLANIAPVPYRSPSIHYDTSVCSKCGCTLVGADGEQSQLAKALGLTLCIDCWLDALYGSYRSDPLPLISTLGTGGKVPTTQLGGEGADATKYLRGDQTWASPIAQAAWGSITGTLSDQTDLKAAIDGKENAGAVSTHESTYNHTNLHGHSNKTILDAVQEALTSPLKASYDWLVTNISSAWKLVVDDHVSSTSNPHSVTSNQVLPNQTGQNGKYLRTDGSNPSWATPEGGGESEVVTVKSGDTANSTTTLADATGLTFNALADSTYIIEVFLLWNSSATTVGIKVSATASGSPTITAGHFITDAANGTPDGSTYNANDVVVTTSASPFTTYNMGKVEAILKTGASASTWQLRFAAETTGTITIKAGSVLRYRKVA